MSVFTLSFRLTASGKMMLAWGIELPWRWPPRLPGTKRNQTWSTPYRSATKEPIMMPTYGMNVRIATINPNKMACGTPNNNNPRLFRIPQSGYTIAMPDKTVVRLNGERNHSWMIGKLFSDERFCQYRHPGFSVKHSISNRIYRNKNWRLPRKKPKRWTRHRSTCTIVHSRLIGNWLYQSLLHAVIENPSRQPENF